MVILTCVYWFRNMAGAHPLMSSHRKVAPATDDVINDVTHEMPVWCQPCGIAVNQLETLGQQNAVYELQMAIEATMPLANRLQRQTLVYKWSLRCRTVAVLAGPMLQNYWGPSCSTRTVVPVVSTGQ